MNVQFVSPDCRPHALCKSSLEDRNSLMAGVVKTLKGYTSKQLRLLYKIGFCMESKIGVTSKRLHNFGICHGITGPQKPHILEHIPNTEEMDQQFLKLHKILSLLPEPRLVTVTRSFRHGFTPRELFPYFEWDILTSVQQNSPGYNSVHYDPDLLGGPPGWLLRLNSDVSEYGGYRLLFQH